MSEFLAGGCVAVVAFALAVLWDLAKFRRDGRARQKTALVGFLEEMSANYGAAENNLTLLAIEQRDIADGERTALLNPLSSLETGAWAIARLDLPRALLADHDLVRRLQIINRNTVDTNGLIQSRENFRIQHLSGHDQVLVDG